MSDESNEGDHTVVKIDPEGPIASDIADGVAQFYKPGERIQRFDATVEGASVEVELIPVPEVMQVVKDALVENDHPDVPDDPELFGVKWADLRAGEVGRVFIREYDPE